MYRKHMHTYIKIYIYIYIYTSMNELIHTLMHTHMHTNIYTYIHPHTPQTPSYPHLTITPSRLTFPSYCDLIVSMRRLLSSSSQMSFSLMEMSEVKSARFSLSAGRRRSLSASSSPSESPEEEEEEELLHE